MQLTVPDMFSGKEIITIFKFRNSFQAACGQNGFHNRAALYGFQVFLSEQAKDQVVPKISGSANPIDARDSELLLTYPEVVRYLLGTHTTDDHLVDAY